MSSEPIWVTQGDTNLKKPKNQKMKKSYNSLGLIYKEQDGLCVNISGMNSIANNMILGKNQIHKQ